MSSFQLKKSFASSDKALTKTVTSVLSDLEVGFSFSTGRLKSPLKIWQVFFLALWARVSCSSNHLTQNQFRLASLGTEAHCDTANNFCLYGSCKNAKLRALCKLEVVSTGRT